MHWDWNALKQWISEQGPAAIAAGDITEVRDDWPISRMQDVSGLDWAISLAYPLPLDALAGIDDEPTLLYKHAYTQVNYLMDRVALGLALRLQESGYRALAIPASQVVVWEEPLGAHADHRQAAVHLGHGWYGRNNILVTPDKGARVRLVTVLTNLELHDPGPWFNNRGTSGCGDCRRCVPACPVGAIHEGPEDFDLEACAARNKSFEGKRGIGQRICGVCVKACSGPPEARKIDPSDDMVIER